MVYLCACIAETAFGCSLPNATVVSLFIHTYHPNEKLKPEARNIVRKYKQLSRASKKEGLPPNVFVFEKTRILMMLLHGWCASFFFFFERCRTSVPSMKSLRVSENFFFLLHLIKPIKKRTRTKHFSLDCVILYPPSAISPKYVQFRKKKTIYERKCSRWA